METETLVTEDQSKSTNLYGENRVNSGLYHTTSYKLEEINVKGKGIITNLEDEELNSPVKGFILNRIMNFLEERLGPYPHN